MLSLRAIERKDIQIIREWRNKYIDYLRQDHLMSEQEQIKWFESDYLKKNIMFAVEIDNPFYDEPEYLNFIGICGLTYIEWTNKKAELSLITENYIDDNCNNILDLLLNVAFNVFNLNKIYCEVYEFDTKKSDFFDRYGFKREAKLKNSVYYNREYRSSIIYSLFKNQFKGE